MAVSLAAFAHTIVKYRRHDKKIAELDQKEKERNEKASRQARLMCHFGKDPEGCPLLVLSNIGQASARDIFITHDENDDGVFLAIGDGGFAYPLLLPGQETAVPAAIAENCSNAPKFVIRYADEDGSHELTIHPSTF